jgi:hypothetical protein
VIRNMLATYGLGGVWLRWLLAPASGAPRLALGLALAVATLALALIVTRRARKLRSSFESVPGRRVTHAGFGQSRWSRDDDDEGFESAVGGGW